MNKKDVKGIMYGRVEGFAEKAAPLYKALDWKWGGYDSPPSEAEIEETLEVLIDHFEEGSCASGGLEVFYNKDDSQIGIRFSYCDSIFF